MLNLHTGRDTVLKWATKFEGGKRQENINLLCLTAQLVLPVPIPPDPPVPPPVRKALGEGPRESNWDDY